MRSIVCLFLLGAAGVFAADPAPKSPPSPPDFEGIHEISIPADQLGSALRRDEFQAVLSRTEYEALVRQAREGVKNAPLAFEPPILTETIYDASLSGRWLLAKAVVQITTFAPNSEVELNVEGWRVLGASLDDSEIWLTREDSKLRALVAGTGTHRLTLSLATPVADEAGGLGVRFSTLGSVSERVTLRVPAESALELNGSDLAGTSSSEKESIFDFAVGGMDRIELRMTNVRQNAQQERLLLARTDSQLDVQPGEAVWSAKVRLQSSGPVPDDLRITLPADLDVTAIDADGLTSWGLAAESAGEDRRTFALTFRESTASEREVSLRGVLATPLERPWRLPNVSIADVASHVGTVTVRHGANLRLRNAEARGVRPIASLTALRPADPRQSVDRFQFWKDDFVLTYHSSLKAEEVRAAMTNLLDVNASGLDLTSTVSLRTQFSPIFEARLRLPAEFTLEDVLFGEESAPWTLAADAAGINEVRVPLDPPLHPGESRTLVLKAHLEPEQWPVQDGPIRVALPDVRLPQAGMIEALYAISGDDELELTPHDLTGLDPAPRHESERLSDVLSRQERRLRLAFAYQDSGIGGQLEIARRPVELNVQSLVFFRVDRETVVTFWESVLSASGGGVRELTVQVSEDAGTGLRFALTPVSAAGTPVRLIEQSLGEVAQGLRTWRLSCDGFLKGEFRLSTECEVPRGEATSFSPPKFILPQAQLQSDFIAIEGAPDDMIRMTATGEDGLPLVSIDPVDFPAARHQPQQRLAAAYRATTPRWNVVVTPERLDRASAPPAVGKQLKIVSVLGSAGSFQHLAKLSFTGYGLQGLLVTLPANTSYMGTKLDGDAVEVRQSAEGILVSVSNLAAGATHELEVLFTSEMSPLERRGVVSATPPKFAVLTGSGERQPLDVLEQFWNLHSPRAIKLVDSTGEFRKETAASSLFLVPTQEELIQSVMAMAIVGSIVVLLAAMWWLLNKWTGHWGKAAKVVFGVLASLGLAVLLVTGFQNPRQSAVGSIVVVVVLLVAMWWLLNKWTGHWGKAAKVVFGVLASLGIVVLLVTGFQIPRESARRTEWKNSVQDFAFPTTPMDFGNEAVQVPAPAAVQNQSPLEGIISESGQIGGLGGGMGGASFGAETANMPASVVKATSRMSVAFDLQPPAQSRETQFVYRGAAENPSEAKLEVHYQQRDAARMLIAVIAIAVAFLGWLSRNAGMTWKIFWIFLTIVAPVALACVLPVDWASPRCGVLLGGVTSVLCWLVCRLGRCLYECCLRSCPKFRHVAGLAILASVCSGGGLFADEKTPDASGTPYVIVPYQTLGELSETDRLWVPARLYQQLWQAAHPDAALDDASRPASVAESRYAATVVGTGDDARVEVQARWVISTVQPDAHSAVLPIRHVQLLEISVNGEGASAAARDDGALSVTLPGRGIQIVDARLQLPANVQASSGEFELALAPSPAGLLSLELPESSVPWRVRVNGAESSIAPEAEDDGRSVRLPVDQGGTLRVEWEAVRNAAGAGGIVHLDTELDVVLDDAGLQLNHLISARTRNGRLNELSFPLQAGDAVRRVRGDTVDRWEVVPSDAGRLLKVRFRDDAPEAVQFEVQLFRPVVLNEDEQTISVQALSPLDVAGESGAIAVYAPEELRVSGDPAGGLRQIDPGALQRRRPDAAAQGAPRLAYRFTSKPDALTLKGARQRSLTRGTMLHGIHVASRKVRLASWMELQLSGPGQRTFTFDLPAGYVLIDVVCKEATDWSVAEEQGVARLTVVLGEPKSGQLELALEGVVARQPGTSLTEIIVPHPVGLERETTFASIWFDASFDAALADAGVWRSISSGEAPGRLRQLQSEPPQFSLRSNQSPSPLRFRTRTAVAEMIADSGILIACSDAAVDYGMTFRWTIANAAADEFVFTAPSWLGTLEFSGENLRETRGDKLADGRTRWKVSLLDPVRGEFFLTAAAMAPIGADQLIRTPLIEFETLRPGGEPALLPTQRRYAALVNLSSQPVAPVNVSQMEAIEASQLPLPMPEDLVRQATEIVRVGPDRLPVWKTQRVQDAGASQAILVAANLTTVLEMDGSWRTRAVYALRSRGRQFIGLRLPEGARILSVLVRGEPSRTVTTKVNEQLVHLVALPQTSAADLSFDVELLLAGRFPRRLPEQFSLQAETIQAPAPAPLTTEESAEFGVPTAQTLWTVYTPDEIEVSPVRSVRKTNLTWHQQDDWLVEERQRLDRLRTDLQALKSIMLDDFQSEEVRQIACSNLQVMETQIRDHRRELDNRMYGPMNYELTRQTLDENQQLIDEAGAARSAFEQRSVTGSTPEERSGRSLILSNNGLFLQQSGQGVAESRKRDDGFRFITSIPSLGKSIRSQEDAGESRQGLRNEIVRQSEIVVGTPIGKAGRAAPVDSLARPGSGAFDVEVSDFGGLDSTSPAYPGRPPATAGDLSIAMDLPVHGRRMSFSKVGGDPKLTLAMRSQQTWKLGKGVLWAVGCVALWLAVVRRLRRQDACSSLVHLFAWLAVLGGAVGFILIPDDARGLCFLAFFLGVSVLAFRFACSPRKVA